MIVYQVQQARPDGATMQRALWFSTGESFGLQKASSQFKRPAVVTVDLNHFDDSNFDTRSLGEPVSPGVGTFGFHLVFGGRTGDTNKKQMDLAGDLFETAIQTIPNDLCITFTTSGTLRATITRLYQAQKEATVRLLLTGITEDCIDTAINQLPFRRFIRVWCHPDVNTAILRIMPGCRHEVASRTFFHYIANAVQDIPNHSPTSIKGVGSTRFHITPGQRSKEGDEGIKCRTRAGRDNWPNVMLEVGCSEPLSQLRIDAEWWLISSKGATNMVIIIQISQQPDALDLEVWKMKPNPSRLTRNSPAEIPFCASTIHVDAHGALTPPNATLTVPYTALFDLPTPYAPDIVITTQQLREISASIFEE